MPDRLCPDCDADISARHPNAKRCEACSWQRIRDRVNASNRRRYANDPEFRAKRALTSAAYRSRPEVREGLNEAKRNWNRSPRGQAARRAYRQRPEVKAANAERMRGSSGPRRREVPPIETLFPDSTPSSLHPDISGRTAKRPAPQTYEAACRCEFREAMEAAAEPRPRECSDCGTEASPDTLERNGGLCGFCAEMERRAA